MPTIQLNIIAEQNLRLASVRRKYQSCKIHRKKVTDASLSAQKYEFDIFTTYKEKSHQIFFIRTL